MADDLSISATPTPGLGALLPDIANDLSEKPKVSAIPLDGGDATRTFKDTLQGLLSDVNQKLLGSDQATRDLADGKTNDIQSVVTSVEEANLALQYTMAIRQKLMDAYQEVSRMQV